MKRPLRPDELNLWARVAATVHLAPGRHAPLAVAEAAKPTGAAAVKPQEIPKAAHKASPSHAEPRRAAPRPPGVPRPIEPGRMRRLTRERDGHGPRLDLHGLDQDQARARLTDFLHRAWREGWRAVLVITGKGTLGDGVLRRMTPEWLAAPALREVVAGVSEAHRRHGGQGALYVALKRRAKT
jgi:DNA-nicking Smr family endonuclease